MLGGLSNKVRVLYRLFPLIKLVKEAIVVATNVIGIDYTPQLAPKNLNQIQDTTWGARSPRRSSAESSVAVWMRLFCFGTIMSCRGSELAHRASLGSGQVAHLDSSSGLGWVSHRVCVGGWGAVCVDLFD